MSKSALLGLQLAVVSGLACAPAITFLPLDQGPTVIARDQDCDIQWLDRSDQIDRPHVRLGELFVGEGGLTVDCAEPRMRELIVSNACKRGAHAVVVLSIRAPSIASSCTQMRVGLVRYTDS